MAVYEFAIGDIKCAALLEAANKVSNAENVERYPGVSLAQIEAAQGTGEGENSCNLLLVESGGQRILADVGFGGNGPPGSGGLAGALEAMQLSPSDIDIVYLTHFHGDHIAGLFDADGAEAFPDSRYITVQAEWDEWMAKWAAADDAQSQASLAQFEALRPRLSFVSPGDSIAPGVSVVDLAGHTNGHTGLLIESGGQRLIHLVDLLHQAFQFQQLDWHFIFDSDGDMAVETRRRVLGQCADDGILCLFYHLRFPGLGHVARDGDGFVWQPI